MFRVDYARGARTWTVHSLEDTAANCSFPTDFTPAKHRLLHGDEFTLDFPTVSLVRRPDLALCGVLLLHGGKCYGKAGNKPLWRLCFDDPRYDTALMPYEIPHVGLSKCFSNVFVIAKIARWAAEEPHPIATCIESLGPTNDDACLEEFDMRRRQVGTHYPLKALTKLARSLPPDWTTHPLLCDMESRRDERIFSIDPPGCTDMDDAVSVHGPKVSVYISNVASVLDVLDAWPLLTERVATVYLGTGRNVPMLPPQLSQRACSLKAQDGPRLALAMDLVATGNGGQYTTSFSFVKLASGIWRNYAYEERALTRSTAYLALLDHCRSMYDAQPFSNLPDGIRDSHDAVCYLMTRMNAACRVRGGMYRVTNDDAKACYQLAPGGRHAFLELSDYQHITSPIRRLPDLLTMKRMLTPTWDHPWLHRVADLNASMLAIRKVQSTSTLLAALRHEPERHYAAERIDETHVYLPELKTVATAAIALTSASLRVRLYAFEREHAMGRRVRCAVVA
jgi:exoribonuclease R